MAIENNKNIHDFNLIRIDDAISRKKLYLIDFKDNQIQQKKGFGYLFARLRHVIYSIIDRTGDKNLAIEKQQFQALFAKNRELLEAQAEQIPKKPLFTGKPYSNPKLINKINVVFAQMNHSAKVTGDLLVLHSDFEKRFGKVSLDDGVPMPNLEQLKAAFAMAEPLQVDFDMSTKETRARYARAIQTIMLGTAVADVEMPEDEICFTCKELQGIKVSQKTVNDEKAFEILLIHNNFKNKFGKVSLEDGVPMPTLKQLKAAFAMAEPLQGDFDMSTSKTRAAYARAIQTIMLGPAASDLPMPEDDICFTCRELQQCNYSEPNSKLDDFLGDIITGDSSYTKNLPDEKLARQSSVNEALNVFFKDHFRDSYDFILSGNSHLRSKNISQEERLSFNFNLFDNFRSDLLHVLILPDQGLLDSTFVKNLEDFNQRFLQQIGRDTNLNSEGVYRIIHEAINRVVYDKNMFGEQYDEKLMEKMRFNEEELNQLIPAYREAFSCTDEEARSKIDLMLSLHLLRILMFSSQAQMAPRELESNCPIFNNLMSRFDIYPRSDLGKYQFFIDPDHFEGSCHWVFGLMYNEPEPNLKLPSGVLRENKPIPSIRSTQRFVLKKIALHPIPKPSEGEIISPIAGNFEGVVVENIHISPLLSPKLDEILEEIRKSYPYNHS